MGEAEAFLRKAEESLASAADDHEKGRYNSCARNTYYAAFQAAVAALIAEGIRPSGRRWEHDLVRAQFAGMLVYRRKVYSSEFRRLLADAFDRRADADYAERMLKRGDVRTMLDLVSRLVGQVRTRGQWQ